MIRPWAPFLVVALLAPVTAGGLACSRSNMLAARSDGSARVSDALADAQVLADAASSDLAGRAAMAACIRMRNATSAT